jgi:hypothetical protein
MALKGNVFQPGAPKKTRQGRSARTLLAMDVRRSIEDKVKVNSIDRAGRNPCFFYINYGIFKSQSSNNYLLYSQ